MLLTVTRLIAAALLIASAAAFATGAILEHHSAAGERHLVRQEHQAQVGTGSEKPADTEGTASSESSTKHAAEHSSEELLGINPEATGLVVTAVAVSLVLAALILTIRSALLSAVAALAMLAFAALDIREVAHQLSESRSGLAALAATIAALHIAAGAAALFTTRDIRSRPRANTA